MRKIVLAAMAWLLVGCADVKSEFVESISGYSNYSSVEWCELREGYYRPNCCDWGAEVGARFEPSFPRDIAAEYWHILQNARTDFHQKSLPLRATATPEVVAALNRTEAMFDTVFVRCVSQEYYMRLFPEMYNETMQPAVDDLTKIVNNSESR